MMTTRSSVVFTLVVLSAVLVVAGCSGRTRGFAVKGSVSYQGKPLSEGVLRLHMAENRMTMAMIQPDGSFEATDVIPGEAKVTVEKRPIQNEWRKKDNIPAPIRSRMRDAAAQSVSLPAKYEDVNTSGLVFTLVPGQPLEINLD